MCFHTRNKKKKLGLFNFRPSKLLLKILPEISKKNRYFGEVFVNSRFQHISVHVSGFRYRTLLKISLFPSNMERFLVKPFFVLQNRHFSHLPEIKVISGRSGFYFGEDFDMGFYHTKSGRSDIPSLSGLCDCIYLDIVIEATCSCQPAFQTKITPGSSSIFRKQYSPK